MQENKHNLNSIKTLRVGFVDSILDDFVAVDLDANLYIALSNVTDSDEYVAVRVEPDFIIKWFEHKVDLLDVFIPAAKMYTFVNDGDFLCLVDKPDDLIPDFDLIKRYKDFDEGDETDEIWIRVYCNRIIDNKESVIENLKKELSYI